MIGQFITFEGGEGTGKSTQCRLLSESLRSLGLVTRLTREPGGTPLAERLRSIILSGLVKSAGPDVEAALFAAARSDHLNKVILPALANCEWVICDRFFDSTAIYQAESGATAGIADVLRHEAVGDFTPDLTIILDLDETESAARAALRRGAEAADRFENENLSFHRNVRVGFLKIAQTEAHRCVVIDATGSPDEVAAKVLHAVKQRFEFRHERVPAFG